MSEQVKQEGEFKLRKPKAPAVKAPAASTVTKVDLSKPKTEEDAIQEQSANESVLQSEQSEMGLQEVEQRNTKQESVTESVEENQEVKTGDAFGFIKLIALVTSLVKVAIPHL